MVTATVKKWTIDPAHSKILFKVKHLVVSTVTGTFDDFEGKIESTGDYFENASVTFSAKTESINTHNKDRDNHLRSDDFFGAQQYPFMKFESTAFHKIDECQYRVVGNLTMRNTTKEVELHAAYVGKTIDPYGKTKIAFEIIGQVNRKDFGLLWSAVTERGGMVVAEEVKLFLEVTAILD